jgi:hypothetical protein
MLPDCQRLEIRRKKETGTINELEYFCVYIPIKLTNVHLTELDRLVDKHANIILNEHWLSVIVINNLLNSLNNLLSDSEETVNKEEIKQFYSGTFCKLITNAGWDLADNDLKYDEDSKSYFRKMQEICNEISVNFSQYTKRLWLTSEPQTYNGPICGYLDFLFPFMQALKKLSFMPNGPIFILVDDSDNLNETQKTILNTWVSYRTTSEVSIKASTQLNYENWRTIFGQTIDSPHDYSEVNISAIYTTSKSKYKSRVEEIVKRRLESIKVYVPPKDFFPPDAEQEKLIEEEKELIRKNYPTEGRGYSVYDDITRYARPNFIAKLKGTSKSGSTYSYAGFDQLVHISSGIIRHFLEGASLMYSEMQSKKQGEIKFIDPSIQNSIVRELAEKFFGKELEKIQNNFPENSQSPLNTAKKLGNLVEALGRIFELQLVSKAAERKVFSIAFSNQTSDEVLEVLKLGIRYGYFHESSIGNKDGTGRTKLYILSRQLAPYFTLDPTSFAGYKFVTSESISKALYDPTSLVRKVQKSGFDEVFQDKQGNLFIDQ